MKFWKNTLFVIGSLVTLSSVVSSCVNDSCKNIMCRNKGTCADEFCTCPTGYEGTQCETLMRDKFLGFYDGITKVDQLPVRIDSAVVFADKADTVIAARTHVFSRSGEQLVGLATSSTEMIFPNETNKSITYKYWKDIGGAERIEVLIEETVDGKSKVTNFQGTKRK